MVEHALKGTLDPLHTPHTQMSERSGGRGSPQVLVNIANPKQFRLCFIFVLLTRYVVHVYVMCVCVCVCVNERVQG